MKQDNKVTLARLTVFAALAGAIAMMAGILVARADTDNPDPKGLCEGLDGSAMEGCWDIVQKHGTIGKKYLTCLKQYGDSPKAKNANRGSRPEARHLRGLTFADHPE
jgi:hypothetical protein